MKEQIKKYWWIIIVILIVGFSFYWYEWRPSQIRIECSKVCDLIAGEFCEDKYQDCLFRHGLDKYPY
jgi:hypothetical protein